MRAERRASYRIALPEGVAVAEDTSTDESFALSALNAAGGSLALAGAAPGDHRRTLRFKLGRSPIFSADVALLGLAAEAKNEPLIAFRFQGLDADNLTIVSGFLCDQHARRATRLARLFSSDDQTLTVGTTDVRRTSRTPDDVLALLDHQVRHNRLPLLLHRPGSAAPAHLTDVDIETKDGRRVLRAATAGQTLEAEDGSEQLFYLPGTPAVAWFRATLHRDGPGHVVVALPSKLCKCGFRSSLRVCPPSDYPVTVTLDGPRPHPGPTRRPVVDLAALGFSTVLDATHDRFCPGQWLEHAQLDLPLGPVDIRCVLRACSPAPDGEGLMAGFEIADFHNSASRDRWSRYVVALLFPDVHLGYEANVAAAWNRLERSGYLELIESDERGRLRRPFFEDWTNQAAHPGFRARFLISYHEGEPVGIAATNLIYPKTCLVHSGGVDREAQGAGKVRKLAQASLLLTYTVADYSLMLFEAHKPINVALFQGFVEQYTAREDNVFDECSVYRWRATGAPRWLAQASDRSLEVVSATDELLRTLWDHQRSTLSLLELDAYGWSPDDQTMRRFSECCARDGYERDRHIFFAVRHRQPIAALIAESGSEGMNVFSLLNSCSVVFLDDVAARQPEVLRQLLVRAVDFYRGAGKGSFLFLGRPSRGPHAALDDLGFSYVAPGWRWLAAKGVIPAYINFVEDLPILAAGRRLGGESRRAEREAAPGRERT